jgi:hypothetical protein
VKTPSKRKRKKKRKNGENAIKKKKKEKNPQTLKGKKAWWQHSLRLTLH